LGQPPLPPAALASSEHASNTLAGLALGSEGVSSEDVLQAFGRDTLSSNPESWKRSVENKIASLTARLAEATAGRFFERATQLGAELAELKEDYRTIYQEFVNNGMPHKEVMRLVGLRRQSPRHRLLVDMMSMLSQFPAFKAQLFSPVAIRPPQPQLPGGAIVSRPGASQPRHVNLQCDYCHEWGHIQPHCPMRTRDQRSHRNPGDGDNSRGAGGPTRHRPARDNQPPYARRG
jgi:uncharacterized protein (UPF0335 family)